MENLSSNAPPDRFNLPILHRIYELYKLFYQYLLAFPKKDRYSLGLKCENLILDILELFFEAVQSFKDKLQLLEKASLKLNILRILIRLAKDVKIIDFKKYLTLQEKINEIGKMLGGWIKSTKDR